MNTRKLRHFAAATALSAMVAVVGSTAAYAACENPVRIAENDWTSNLVNVKLVETILNEHMGIEAESIFADYTGQWTGMANGDLDVAVEVWHTFSYAAHDEWVTEKGKVERLSGMGMVGEVHWYVPTYVIKGDAARGIEPMAPDLKSWKDIEKYAHLFTRPETGDKVFCIDGVESWENHNEGRIEKLGLNMVNKYAGSEGALVAEIAGAYDRGEALFICNMWEPHWVLAKYDLTVIELPPYTEECYGMNTESPAHYGCGWPVDKPYNIARVGFEDECPAAHQLLDNMSISSAEIQKLLLMVDDEGMEVAAAVKAWMADNEGIWKKWIP
jgi:glycine betaine/proline transport system substrate-binding protein